MGFTLRDYQQKCHDDTLNYIGGKDGNKPSLVVLPTGCHEKGYQVFKEDGSLIKVEDIQVGDTLMGDDSTKRTVLHLHQGEDTMYKITLKTCKVEFIVNKSHVLHLVRTNLGKDKSTNSYPETVDISLEDYLKWAPSRKHLYKIKRVGFELSSTPETWLDPYFLGLWLGDGSKNHVEITSMESEVMDFLESYAQSLGMNFIQIPQKNSKASLLKINNGLGQKNQILTELQRLNLINNKHIPEELLTSSREIRERLLAGLIDSDGYMRGPNYEISQKSKRLADDIYRLIGSLGFHPYMRPMQKRCTNCKYPQFSTYYRITFRCTYDIKNLVERRKYNKGVPNKAHNLYEFKIEEVGVGEYYGFTLDGNQLYIDQNFVIHHNCGKSISIAKLVQDVGDKVLILSPSQEILSQNYKKYTDLGGEACIYSASLSSKNICDVTYATLGSIKKLGPEFKRLGFRTLLLDEAHLGTDPEDGMFKSFIKSLEPNHIIGYTATPFRLKSYSDMSGYNYSQLNIMTRTRPKFFSNITHVTQVPDVVRDGFWASVKVQEYKFNPTGLVLNSNGSEYTDSSIKSTLEYNNVNNNIYKLTKSIISDGGSSILMFLDSVDNCYKMAKALGDTAIVIEAKTNKKERAILLEKFKAGECKVAICVSTLTVGFDFPELSVVIMGRPTNSLAVFYQIYGRLVRPYENKEAVFYDFCGNISKFGRMENLVLEDYNNYGWGLFNDNILLTGKPMGGDPVTKDDLDKMNSTEKGLFTFGKYKGVNLKDIPMSYITWALENTSDKMSHKLKLNLKQIMTTQ